MADKRPRRVRDEKYFEYEQGLSLGLISPHLLTASAHLGAQQFAHRRGSSSRPTEPAGRTPLVRALALHGVSGCAGSHLDSILNSEGAVAYIRAAASPSEVLARTCWHRDQVPSNASSEFPHVGLITQNWKDDCDTLGDLRRTSTIAGTARTLSKIKYHTAAERRQRTSSEVCNGRRSAKTRTVSLTTAVLGGTIAGASTSLGEASARI